MKKFIVLALFLVMSSFTSNADAYNWFKEYEFYATRLVKVPKGYNNFDHVIYYFTDAQGRPSLLFMCHGSVNNQGQYFAYMGDKWHSDYASAVDNEIRYHINRGEVRNNFEKVYFLTCHAGYAPQKTVTMPVLNKQLQMALYNKSVQGLREYYDYQGRVYYVELLQDHSNTLGEDTVTDSFNPVVDGVIIAGNADE